MANILLINPSWRSTCKNILSSFDIVGFTFTTPLFLQVIQLSKTIQKLNPDILKKKKSYYEARFLEIITGRYLMVDKVEDS